MWRWIVWLARLWSRLLLAPVRPYRDNKRRRIKATRALERLQAGHAQLQAEYESQLARNRELLEELSLCRNPEHQWWHSPGDRR